MRRVLRIRMLVVLLALALIPASTLPFAGRIRSEWDRFWRPAEEMELVETLDYDIPIPLSLPPIVEIELIVEEPRIGRELTVPLDPHFDLPDA